MLKLRHTLQIHHILQETKKDMIEYRGISTIPGSFSYAILLWDFLMGCSIQSYNVYNCVYIYIWVNYNNSLT